MFNSFTAAALPSHALPQLCFSFDSVIHVFLLLCLRFALILLELPASWCGVAQSEGPEIIQVQPLADKAEPTELVRQ